MKFIYVEQDDNLRDLYSMKLEADYNANVIEFSTEEEARDYLTDQKDLEDVKLILMDADLIADKGSMLYKHLRENAINIPYVFLSNQEVNSIRGLDSFFLDHPGNRQIKKPVNEGIFRRIINEALQTSPGSGNWLDKSKDGYSQVRINHFLRFNKLPCDAYIKLGQGKFVKLINKDDMYTSEIIKKYVDKNVNYLHVKKDMYPILANTGIRTLLSLYERRPKNVSTQDLQLASLEDIHNSIQDLGFSKEATALTKRTLQSSINTMKRSKSISSLLNNMKANGDYIYDHSLRISYVATAIARNTEWSSDSTAYKLSLASMMHDMTLEDHDLAKIQVLDDPNIKNYSEDQFEKYKTHPSDAAVLIKENKYLPPDVDFIVAQHHERPDGSGFPRGLSKLRISPLSCLFILAHEFVTRVEQRGGKYNVENRDAVFEELNTELYTLGNFKKPFKGLQKAFGIKKSVAGAIFDD